MRRIDIKPYWSNIVEYYWENLDSDGKSIWEWLSNEYEMKKAFGSYQPNKPMSVVCYNDEKFTLFLLRWGS